MHRTSESQTIFTGGYMNITVNSVGFTMDQDQTDLVNKKLERIKYAEDLIVSGAVKVKEDKKYYFDTTLSFRWGATAHVEADDYEFATCLNKMIDMLDLKIKKEKDKVQQK